jgi:hypothetical protein
MRYRKSDYVKTDPNVPIDFAPVLRIRKYFFWNYGSDPGSQLFKDPAGSVSYLDPEGKLP